LRQSLPPEMAANLVGQLLGGLPMLVIFDNFEDLLERVADRFRIRDENLRTFITTLVKATPAGSRFLFTTRHLFDLGDGRLGDVLALPLGDLSRPEAIYLMQRMPRLGATSSGDKDKVLERFGGHPFSLVTVDKHCQFSPLAEVLDKASRLHTELREHLGIELNCARLSDRSRELLNRLAAFRHPMPITAAEWVMGEKVSLAEEIDQILATLNRETLPDEWKQLDDAELLTRIEAVLPKRISAPNLESEIKELIEWGLLTPINEDGAAQGLAVHSLVREFCRDRQTGERRSECLREAAAFYTNFTRMISDERKELAAVWAEMEAFELLMEAEEYEAAVDLLAGNTELLGRWGFGRELESRYRRIIHKVSGRRLAMVTHNLAVQLQARGEYGEALRRYEQSLRMLEELDDRAGVARSLHQIGLLHQQRGEYGEALRRYEQSMQIGEELDDRAVVAGSLYQIGDLHRLRGEYGEALERYEQSLRMAEELDDRAVVAISLHQIGLLHQQRGEYGEALQRYEQSMRIKEELNDRAGVAISLHQIGNLHYLRGEYGEALERYEQSLRMAEELDDRAVVARSLHQIGLLHQDRGEYEDALRRYEQSLRIKKELGDRAGVARSLHQIGNLHYLR
jgi:tetratricopeptide (TPR) repeat protein